MNSRKLLQIPQGTESFYLDEALQHRRMVETLQHLYTLWGYLPVETPVFDYYDIYADLLDRDTIEKTYRLIDRDGELLMLRSDITLFVAKQMGMLLQERQLPVRVYYSGAILRHNDKEDISHNEFFQSGIELIGRPGAMGDLEVLSILCRTFEELGIRPFIHIGTNAFFLSVTANWSEMERSRLRKAVHARDAAKTEAILKQAGLDQARIREITRLFLFLGDATAFEKCLTGLATLSETEQTALRELENAVRTLFELFPETGLRADLSEVGSQPYYTGMVFQAYVEGVDSAVASGGRYDRLLEYFGFPCPSVGFSLLLRKLQKAVKLDDKQVEVCRLTEKYDRFQQAYRAAEQNRKQGIITQL